MKYSVSSLFGLLGWSGPSENGGDINRKLGLITKSSLQKVRPFQETRSGPGRAVFNFHFHFGQALRDALDNLGEAAFLKDDLTKLDKLERTLMRVP